MLLRNSTKKGAATNEEKPNYLPPFFQTIEVILKGPEENTKLFNLPNDKWKRDIED